jgi:hypothetical protein
LPRFAIYYIPKAGEEFYRLGTSIVSYDVRSGKHVKMPEGFLHEWVDRAQLYGFHLTIGCPIDFNFGQLLYIEKEIDDILKCFNPEHKFTLIQTMDAFPWLIGKAILLRYDPNDYLKIFHTLMLTLAQKYGTGSFYIERLYNNPEQYKKPYMVNRILKFYNYPYILDDWTPHFTLLDNYNKGEKHQEIIQFITDKFIKYKEIIIDTISLLIQTKDGDNWRIYKEYSR